MKAKLIETKFQSALGFVSRLFSRVACLGAAILICSGTSAQNLFVSGGISGDSCGLGKIYEFTWDGAQSIFASTCNPSDVAFDNAGNLYVVNWELNRIYVQVFIDKYTPNGVETIFASGLSLPSYLAVDGAGSVFVGDYTNGIIYKYTPTGARTKIGRAHV